MIYYAEKVNSLFCLAGGLVVGGFWMNKRDEKRMWEGNYFFIHFILLMKKKHFCLVGFSKHLGKEPLLILQTIKMKAVLRKLILPFPSLHQLQGNLTCLLWTSSSKLKIHF